MTQGLQFNSSCEPFMTLMSYSKQNVSFGHMSLNAQNTIVNINNATIMTPSRKLVMKIIQLFQIYQDYHNIVL